MYIQCMEEVVRLYYLLLRELEQDSIQLMETSNQMSMDLERLLNHNQVHEIHIVYTVLPLIIEVSFE